MTGKNIKVSASKGSVFDDLGFAPEHRIKADMALMIKSRMKTLKLNQTKAANLIGIKQPDLSNILRGHFRGYSVERLTRLLTALDCDVDIVIRPRGDDAKPHVIRMNSVLA
ncbi:MAG: XRE family transcriptional regulator [Robiginitomaculum sp.]|nr:MAG: XRE family transcriptional regulator [Robiginitomaculum sp.]